MVVLSRRAARTFWKDLPTPLAGVDEAGRGCLAGPVVAAAVILPDKFRTKGLRDSKQVPLDDRLRLEKTIKQRALAWAIGCAWPPEIDELNILGASLQAMKRAVLRLKLAPVYVVVDGNQPIPHEMPQTHVVDGDELVPVISAASILAKTFRDRLMAVLDRRYPGYGFSHNKGYGTREHWAALNELGYCRLHRRSFKGVVPGLGEELWLPGI
jgi:ribonuclease HII